MVNNLTNIYTINLKHISTHKKTNDIHRRKSMSGLGTWSNYCWVNGIPFSWRDV